MDAIFAGVPWATLTPGTLLGAAVIMLLRGDLVPRKTLTSVEAERDTWRAACDQKDETIRELAESAATTAAVLRALPTVQSDSK